MAEAEADVVAAAAAAAADLPQRAPGEVGVVRERLDGADGARQLRRRHLHPDRLACSTAGCSHGCEPYGESLLQL